MTLTDELYESVKDIWSEYYKHPFVEGNRRRQSAD